MDRCLCRALLFGERCGRAETRGFVLLVLHNHTHRVGSGFLENQLHENPGGLLPRRSVWIRACRALWRWRGQLSVAMGRNGHSRGLCRPDIPQRPYAVRGESVLRLDRCLSWSASVAAIVACCIADQFCVAFERRSGVFHPLARSSG